MLAIRQFWRIKAALHFVLMFLIAWDSSRMIRYQSARNKVFQCSGLELELPLPGVFEFDAGAVVDELLPEESAFGMAFRRSL